MEKGKQLQSAHHFSEAQGQFRKALQEAEKLNSPRLQADALFYQATAAEDLGQMDKAAELCSRAVAILGRNVGQDDPDLQRIRIELAAVYIPSGQFSTADALLRQTLDAQFRAGEIHSLEAGMALEMLASLYAHQQKFGKAEDTIRQAVRILEEVKAPPEVMADARVTFGVILNRRRRHAEALAQTELAAEIAKTTPQVQPFVRIAILANLASLYTAEGRLDPADAAARESLSFAIGTYGPEHLYSGWMWLMRASILRKAHKKSEASEAQHRGQRILDASGIERLGQTIPYTALLP